MVLARLFILFCVLPLLAACSPDSVVPDADKDIAEQLIRDLVARDDERVLAILLSDVREQLRTQLPQMSALLPSGEVNKPELLEARHMTFSDGTQRTISEIVYAVRGAEREAWVRVGVLREPHLVGVGSLHVGDLGAIEAANAFTFSGKPALNYAFLALMLVCVAVSVTAALIALRMPGLRWRWAWVLGSLVGFSRLALNWSTGEIVFHPLQVMLLGAGFGQSPLSAWHIFASPPVIAIVFLVLGDRVARRA